jgi:hypothetical protein
MTSETAMPDPTNQLPPPVINSARVLAYAFVDDIAYRKWGRLYHGDTLIEIVPRLAICSNLGKDIGSLLFHGDEEWNVLGTLRRHQSKDVASRQLDDGITPASYPLCA